MLATNTMLTKLRSISNGIWLPGAWALAAALKMSALLTGLHLDNGDEGRTFAVARMMNASLTDLKAQRQQHRRYTMLLILCILCTTMSSSASSSSSSASLCSSGADCGTASGEPGHASVGESTDAETSAKA